MAGVVLFHSPITVHFLVGSFIVLCATYMYNLPDRPVIVAHIDGSPQVIQIPERPLTPPLRSPIPPEVGRTESLHASQFQAQVQSSDNKLRYTNRLSISHSSTAPASPNGRIPLSNGHISVARPKPESPWQASEKESYEPKLVNGSPYAGSSPRLHSRSLSRPASSLAFLQESGPNEEKASIESTGVKEPGLSNSATVQRTPSEGKQHLHHRSLSKSQG